METNAVQHSLQSANANIQAETIRAVDQHLESHSVPDENTTLSTVWQVARPVLVFLEAALFLAPKWHKALKTLVAAMDTFIDLHVESDSPLPVK